MADLKQLQQQRERQSRNKSSSSKGGWLWIVFVVIALLANLDTDGLEIAWREFEFRLRHGLVNVGEIFAPIFCVILLVSVLLLRRKIVKKRKKEVEHPYAAARTSAAVQRRDPRTASFTKPEAPCIVCDHTGEDHFQRDKARRLAQLDDWLKIGLIDRNEYRVMRDRYERGI